MVLKSTRQACADNGGNDDVRSSSSLESTSASTDPSDRLDSDKEETAIITERKLDMDVNGNSDPSESPAREDTEKIIRKVRFAMSPPSSNDELT